MKSHKEEIEERVEFIIESHPVHVAIQRINGYLELFFWNQNIKSKLAELYYRVGDKVSAGEFWYFDEAQDAIKTDCIEAFRQSLGNDLEHISRN